MAPFPAAPPALSLDAMTETTSPRAALLLGYAGLLPAVALVLALTAGPPGWRGPAFQAHMVYAAAILSFVGGAWWGLASAASAPRVGVLTLSVLPSIGGWLLASVGGAAAMLGLGLLFVALLPVDLRLVRAGLAPSWWLRLRVPLSTGMAVLAIVAAAAGG
jgi:hypothetical protein